MEHDNNGTSIIGTSEQIHPDIQNRKEAGIEANLVEVYKAAIKVMDTNDLFKDGRHTLEVFNENISGEHVRTIYMVRTVIYDPINYLETTVQNIKVDKIGTSDPIEIDT